MYVAYAGCVTHDYAFKTNMHKHLRTYVHNVVRGDYAWLMVYTECFP